MRKFFWLLPVFLFVSFLGMRAMEDVPPGTEPTAPEAPEGMFPDIVWVPYEAIMGSDFAEDVFQGAVGLAQERGHNEWAKFLEYTLDYLRRPSEGVSLRGIPSFVFNAALHTVCKTDADYGALLDVIKYRSRHPKYGEDMIRIFENKVIKITFSPEMIGRFLGKFKTVEAKPGLASRFWGLFSREETSPFETKLMDMAEKVYSFDNHVSLAMKFLENLPEESGYKIYLDFKDTPVTDEIVALMSGVNHRINWVNLSRTEIVGFCFGAIAKKQSFNLKGLYCDNCKELDGNAIAFLEHALQLEELDLTGCSVRGNNFDRLPRRQEGVGSLKYLCLADNNELGLSAFEQIPNSVKMLGVWRSSQSLEDILLALSSGVEEIYFGGTEDDLLFELDDDVIEKLYKLPIKKIYYWNLEVDFATEETRLTTELRKLRKRKAVAGYGEEAMALGRKIAQKRIALRKTEEELAGLPEGEQARRLELTGRKKDLEVEINSSRESMLGLAEGAPEGVEEAADKIQDLEDRIEWLNFVKKKFVKVEDPTDEFSPRILASVPPSIFNKVWFHVFKNRGGTNNPARMKDGLLEVISARKGHFGSVGTLRDQFRLAGGGLLDIRIFERGVVSRTGKVPRGLLRGIVEGVKGVVVGVYEKILPGRTFDRIRLTRDFCKAIESRREYKVRISFRGTTADDLLVGQFADCKQVIAFDCSKTRVTGSFIDFVHANGADIDFSFCSFLEPQELKRDKIKRFRLVGTTIKSTLFTSQIDKTREFYDGLPDDTDELHIFSYEDHSGIIQLLPSRLKTFYLGGLPSIGREKLFAKIPKTVRALYLGDFGSLDVRSLRDDSKLEKVIYWDTELSEPMLQMLRDRGVLCWEVGFGEPYAPAEHRLIPEEEMPLVHPRPVEGSA